MDITITIHRNKIEVSYDIRDTPCDHYCMRIYGYIVHEISSTTLTSFQIFRKNSSISKFSMNFSQNIYIVSIIMLSIDLMRKFEHSVDWSYRPRVSRF